MSVIEVQDLWKRFRGRQGTVEALRGVSLNVEAGEIFGFLGPNGAGKTTTLRILATLLTPDQGRATVAGHDLVREPGKVRSSLGYISQLGGADGAATGRENLLLQARLYGLTRHAAEERVASLIEQLELTSFVERFVRTYSGGQRRRLDLALGLVHRPALLFLDEPSLGLDPQSRVRLWEEVRAQRAAGATLLLTTHYLEEADHLCDRLAIIDDGLIVAEGTPDQLKQQIIGDVLTLRLEQPDARREAALELLRAYPTVRSIQEQEESLQLYVEQGEESLVKILRVLEEAQIGVNSVALARPSLDDVFLRQTGHALRDQTTSSAANKWSRQGQKRS
ncbi:MAG TPA: ATP-binding cassette domain-containing protein [Ktedonobacteraceae bacterium]